MTIDESFCDRLELNLKMDDKNIAKNLVNKYLDCAKLLINNPWPDNFADTLYDISEHTKLFADKVKCIQSKSASSSRCVPYEIQTRSMKATSTVVKKSFKYKPRVSIERMDMQKIIETGVILEKDNIQPPDEEVANGTEITETDEINRSDYIEQDVDVRVASNGRNNKCAMQ